MNQKTKKINNPFSPKEILKHKRNRSRYWAFLSVCLAIVLLSVSFSGCECSVDTSATATPSSESSSSTAETEILPAYMSYSEGSEKSQNITAFFHFPAPVKDFTIEDIILLSGLESKSDFVLIDETTYSLKIYRPTKNPTTVYVSEGACQYSKDGKPNKYFETIIPYDLSSGFTGLDISVLGDADNISALSVLVDRTPHHSLTDINNDGKQDLVIGSTSGKINVFQNIEKDRYKPLRGIDNPFADIDVGRWSVPAFSDLYNNGLQDLIVGSEEGDLVVYSNAGDGTYSNVGLGPLPAPPDGAENVFPRFVDLFGNGHHDLVLGQRKYDMLAYSNDGANNYTLLVGEDNIFSNLSSGVNTYFNPTFVDFYDNGLLDIVLSISHSGLTFYSNRGIGQGYASVSSHLSGLPTIPQFSDTLFVDLYENGLLDMLVGNPQEGNLFVYSNTGDYVYEKVTLPFENPFRDIDVSNPVFVDLYGDDDVWDIVYRGGMLSNNVTDSGESSFTELTENDNPFNDSVPLWGGNYFAYPSFADIFGNDGILDLIVGEVRLGNFLTYSNEGNLSFVEITGADNPLDGFVVTQDPSASTSDPLYPSPTFVDLYENDEYLDLVSGGNGGDILVWSNTGTAFVALDASENPFDSLHQDFTATRPRFVDFYNNGRLDLLIGHDEGALFYSNAGDFDNYVLVPIENSPLKNIHFNGTGGADLGFGHVLNPENVDAIVDGKFYLNRAKGNEVADFIYIP